MPTIPFVADEDLIKRIKDNRFELASVHTEERIKSKFEAIRRLFEGINLSKKLPDRFGFHWECGNMREMRYSLRGK